MSKKVIIIISTEQLFNLVADVIKNSGYEPFHYEGPSSLSKIKSSDVYAIIDLFNNKDHELVKDFLDYTVLVNARYVYVYALSDRKNPEVIFIKKLITDYKKYKGLNSIILETGDLYGREYTTSKKLQEHLNAIVAGKPLIVDNDYKRHHLIHIEDFMNGLVQAVSCGFTGIYSLRNREAILEIEFANFLNELSELKNEIKYIYDENTQTSLDDIDIVLNILPNWTETISLEEGVLEMFEVYDIPSYVSVKTEIIDERLKIAQDVLVGKASFYEKKAQKHRRDVDLSDLYNDYEYKRNMQLESSVRSKKINGVPDQNVKVGLLRKIGSFKTALFSFTLIMLFLLVPTFVYAVNFVSADLNINRSFRSFNNKDFKSSQMYSLRAINSTENLVKVPAPIALLFRAIHVSGPDLSEYIGVIRNSGYILNSTASILQYDGNQDHVLGVSSFDNADFSSTVYQIDELIDRDTFFSKRLSDYKEILIGNDVIFRSAKSFKNLIDLVLGKHNDQRFLIVFQNDDVSRPNGGIVYDFGILNIKNGSISFERLPKLQDINSQLTSNGFLPSPTDAVIDDYDGVEDLAFSPNFSVDAKKWIEAISPVSSGTFDGVVAINNRWLTDLFGSSNLVHFDYFVSKIGKLPVDHMIRSLINGLHHGDIQVYSTDEKIESLIVDSQWSSNVNAFDGDFVYVVHANIGKSGLDSKLNKVLTYQGYDPISSGIYTRRLEIKYGNKNDTGITEHVSIFVPPDSVLKGFKLVDNGNDKNIYKEVIISGSNNYTSFSTDIYIETGHDLSVDLVYESPRRILDDNKLNVSFQKQPGDSFSDLIFKLDGDEQSYTFSDDITVSIPIFRLAKVPE